jgi:hypothetical protein
VVDVTHMPGDHGPPELATAEAVAAGLTDSHKHEHKTTIDAAYFMHSLSQVYTKAGMSLRVADMYYANSTPLFPTGRQAWLLLW